MVDVGVLANYSVKRGLTSPTWDGAKACDTSRYWTSPWAGLHERSDSMHRGGVRDACTCMNVCEAACAFGATVARCHRDRPGKMEAASAVQAQQALLPAISS